MKHYLSLLAILCSSHSVQAMEHDPFVIFQGENNKLLQQLKNASDYQENAATCLAGYNLSTSTIEKLPDTPFKDMNLAILNKAKQEWLERYNSLTGMPGESTSTVANEVKEDDNSAPIALQQSDQAALDLIWQDYLKDPAHLKEVRWKAYEVARERPKKFKKFPKRQLWKQAQSNCKDVMLHEPLPPISEWPIRGSVKKANKVLYSKMIEEGNKLKTEYLHTITS